MNPVMVVRRQVKFADEVRQGRGCWMWCPGCNEAHRPEIIGEEGDLPPGPCWQWDGNLEAPTFTPSLLVGKDTDRVCHSFITNGQWVFLPDCTHALAGQTVDMVPLPDWLVFV
jgi:Family of unknown function (DUF6527)